MRALVFVSRDQAELYDAAERLVLILNGRRALPSRLIDKLSSRVDDLKTIAAYGTVEPIVVVLEDDSGLRARVTELTTPQDLERMAARLEGSPTPQA